MVEEQKEGYDSEIIKDSDPKRVNQELRPTGLVEANKKFDYNQLGSIGSAKPHEVIKISDMRIVMHSNLINYLILLKVILTVFWLIGIGKKQFLWFLPVLLLEFIGIAGSINLNRRWNIAFAVCLSILILVRVISSLYLLSDTEIDDTCFSDRLYSFDSKCIVNSKYAIGNGFLVLVELCQLIMAVNLIRGVQYVDEEKLKEISYVIMSGRVPRFVCCGKIRAWKLTNS